MAILKWSIWLHIPSAIARNGPWIDHPDPLNDFITMLAVPEVLSTLVSIDYQCTLEDAFNLSWLAQPFVMHEYPFDPDCLVYKGLISKVRRERGADNLFDSEDSDSLSDLVPNVIDNVDVNVSMDGSSRETSAGPYRQLMSGLSLQ